MRRYAAAFTAATLLALSLPQAVAQIPPGMNAQSAISGPISVPAGQTTTVDLGVPVSASYSGGGWNVVSSGTSVTVTAPASGSASVPVSAMGQSATITLIAEQGAEVPEEVQPAPAPGGERAPAPGADNSGQPGETKPGETKPNPGGQVATPPDENRKPAPEVNRTETEQIKLNATIEGNRIVAKLGLVQAANLYNKFGNQSQDGVKLRYMDVNGRLIEGVKREINKEARTLTLTYPEGQTPDNPFVMEAVRDGNSIAVVTLTDPNVAAAVPADPASSPVQPGGEDDGNSSKKIGLLVGAGVLALVVVVGAISAVASRRRRR